MKKPEIHTNADEVADRIITALGGRIVLGLPLGLGKAPRIANALYRRAAADPTIELKIFTALTLEPPSWSSDMERRFVEPLNKRLFSGYERFDYATALRNDTLPPNIKISEFFLLASRWLDVPAMQQSYVSANYTHAVHYILDHGVNVIAHLVAKRGMGTNAHYSLSCNSDITLDILPPIKASGRPFLLVGEVSDALPYMAGDAALPAAEWDHVLDAPVAGEHLFAPPKEPVSKAEHAIGIQVASLVRDGGTLQIGIGSLGDAVTAALILRHRAPALFRETLRRLCHGVLPDGRETEPFTKGLYAASEMFVDGFAELYRAGILKRKAADGAVLHAGFFLGSEDFYRFLRDLSDDERNLFQMRGISFINELYGDEAQKRADRVDARFVNAAMMVTLLGAVVSDGLDDGRVVSGVGGQYNFVAQAFALEGARSIITLTAARNAKGKRHSRILWTYGHTTIPRHLRDMVVTEYGVADLRGRSDRDCIAAMLAVSDMDFQGELLADARRARKIEEDFKLAENTRKNTPDVIAEALAPAQAAGYCDTFPFGTTFSDEEQTLLPALKWLADRTATPLELARTVVSSVLSPPSAKPYDAELKRMALDRPKGVGERLKRRLLITALDRTVSRQ